MKPPLYEAAVSAAQAGINIARKVPGVDLAAELTGMDRRIYPHEPAFDPLVGRVAIVGSAANRWDGQTSDQIAYTTAATLTERNIIDEQTPVQITSLVPEVARPSTVRALNYEAGLLAEAIEEQGLPKPYVSEVPIVVAAAGTDNPANDVLNGIRRNYDFVKQTLLRLQEAEPKIIVLGNVMHMARVFEDINAGRFQVGRFAVLSSLSGRPEKSQFVAH